MPCERILVPENELKRIVSDLAKQICLTYSNIDNIIALVMLEGARTFANDLTAQLDFSIETVFVKASSYCNRTCSAGHVRIDGSEELLERTRGKNILLIDDIYDTGLTLTTMLHRLKHYNPLSIKICVLLEKEIVHAQKIRIDFRGLTVENAFVVGYGLDFDGQYRDLPFIGILSPEHARPQKG